MDDRQTERTPASSHTTINHTEPKSSGSGVMWFLMGAVVIVVIIIGYFMMSDGSLTGSGASQSDGGNVSINVETNDTPTEPAPTNAAPEETAPATTESPPQAD